jgi:hypothetical protein
MKVLLLALVALVSTAASAAELSAIDCLASNGVTIKGESVRGEAVRAQTHWGFLRKDFVATITAGPEAGTTYVSLSAESGTEYLLALKAKSNLLRRSQKASGSILAVSSVRGVSPSLVAVVACDVTLR